MEVSEVLYRAANHIQEHGHFKGAGHGPVGDIFTAPACTIGAISVVTLNENVVSMEPALSAFLDYLGTCIPYWNDARERTAAEVIEALRACAVIEAAKESPALELAAPVAAVGSAG